MGQRLPPLTLEHKCLTHAWRFCCIVCPCGDQKDASPHRWRADMIEEVSPVSLETIGGKNSTRLKQSPRQWSTSYLFWKAHSDGHHWSSVYIIDQATWRSLESLKETWRLLMWAYNCFSSFRSMQLTEYFSRHLKHFLRLIAQRGLWVCASSGCSVISQYKVISEWELCFCKIVGWDESSTLLSCEGTKQPHWSLWIFQGIRILRGRL